MDDKPRRGSSLFSNPAAAGGGGGAPGVEGKKRQSVVLSGMGGGFGIDFDDSDFDDSDEEDVPHGGPYGGRGPSAQAVRMSSPSQIAGTEASRPMVGGFAAAAYEAARAHHFQNKAKQQALKGEKPGQPPPPKGSQASKKPH